MILLFVLSPIIFDVIFVLRGLTSKVVLKNTFDRYG